MSFRGEWHVDAEREWPGPEYWANPLQDWRIRRGRLECISPGGDRNVALLTREVANRPGDFYMQVHLGRMDDHPLDEGFVGFRIGSKHQMGDFRATAIYGQGLNAGIDAAGCLFIGERRDDAPRIDLASETILEFHAQPSINGYKTVLRARVLKDGATVETMREVPGDWLIGGVALVCSSGPVQSSPAKSLPIKDFNFYPPQQQRGGTFRFWFANWVVAGSKVDEHNDRAYGPILFTLYTTSRDTAKLSAQFPPLGNGSREVTLLLQDKAAQWRKAATAEVDPDAWNATFRLSPWDSQQTGNYRILYAMPDGGGAPKQYTYDGILRKDPMEKQDVTIGLLTCTWDFGFPHADFIKHLSYHRPDILFWTGDQVYEQVGGFGAIKTREAGMEKAAMLDFLRKWYIFGWAMRGLTREIPSVCMTDDHDMFHGNIWGCGGRPTNPAIPDNFGQQDSGGYKMWPRWVNMVQRLQTSHLPDPFDPAPVQQGIGVYYTHLQYGGISFAILEDRKWKSAPKEHMPDAKIFNGFPMNPAWRPAVDSDVADAELLGQRQLEFLEYWAADWGAGTWMKFAVSQTPFGCLHTEPSGSNTDDNDPHEAIPEVGSYIENDHLVADHDSGAWPQRERNTAIMKFRKAFAPHLCGDQHLGTTAQYGVNKFLDGVYSVCTPAISNIFPRRWFPPESAPHAKEGTRNTGNYRDAFGNRMTVFAVANPAQYPGPGLDGIRYRATGYTIITCNRATRKTTVAVWPRWLDPSLPGATPFHGWPISFDQLDNGLAGAEWVLAPITTAGVRNAVVQVQIAATGEVVYTIRCNGESFIPLVRDPGTYTVLVYDPDGGYRREWLHVEARRRDSAKPT